MQRGKNEPLLREVVPPNKSGFFLHHAPAYAAMDSVVSLDISVLDLAPELTRDSTLSYLPRQEYLLLLRAWGAKTKHLVLGSGNRYASKWGAGRLFAVAAAAGAAWPFADAARGEAGVEEFAVGGGGGRGGEGAGHKNPFPQLAFAPVLTPPVTLDVGGLWWADVGRERRALVASVERRYEEEFVGKFAVRGSGELVLRSGAEATQKDHRALFAQLAAATAAIVLMSGVVTLPKYQSPMQCPGRRGWRISRNAVVLGERWRSRAKEAARGEAARGGEREGAVGPWESAGERRRVPHRAKPRRARQSNESACTKCPGGQ